MGKMRQASLFEESKPPEAKAEPKPPPRRPHCNHWYEKRFSELTVEINGKKYLYRDISPYHLRQFRTKLRRNFAKAMDYIKGFLVVDKA